jgi:putative N6-adenine-specific DNA methylase
MDETVFASTTPGLEGALELEAQALGRLRKVMGGVEIVGAAGLHRRANLWLRTASRVLLRLAVLEAPNEVALGRALTKLSLTGLAPAGAPIALETSASHAKLHASALAALAHRAWPGRAEGGAGGLGIWLRLEGDRCTVSVDSSGELLYRRGYRQEISRAPMRETLAAGLLLLAGYQGDVPLWDPFCGSGTIVIEAALIALRRAPGLHRHFAFESWPSHDPARWEQEQNEGRGLSRLPAPIWGSDLHAGSLGTARRNARRAGLEGQLELFRHDATVPRPGLPPAALQGGLVASNLPYGVRVGTKADLGALYRGLGRTLAALPGWRAALLVSGAGVDVERQLGWTPREAHSLDNGGIRCRLLTGSLEAEPAS